MSVKFLGEYSGQKHTVRIRSQSSSYLQLVSLSSLAFGSYFVLRYFGLWSEQDTAVFTSAIVGMQSAERLRYGGAYPHGYAYSVWASFLSDLTGLRLTDLIQLYTPLIGNVFLGVFGFAAFRRLLASERSGLFATAVLFLIPELVFTVSRGNHEKLTVSLTLLALLALLHSFRESLEEKRWRVFAAWLAVFYVVIFTLATLNAFFGSIFVAASTLVLIFAAAGWLIRPKARARLYPVLRQLALMVGTSWLLVILVTWYIYPSGGETLELFKTAFAEMSKLFSSVVAPAAAAPYTVSDPYAVSGTDWASPEVYRLLSSFRWLLFAGSLATWFVLLVRALRRLEVVPLPHLFLLAFYGAFGLLLGLAIPVDFLGLAAGSNLQVRLYTYFCLLAPPLLVGGTIRLLEKVRPRALKALLVGLIAVLFSSFALLSLLKATLDPAVSNRWLFYDTSEVRAIRFWDLHHRYSALWVGDEGRLAYAYVMRYPSGSANTNVIPSPLNLAPHALYSPILQANEVAWFEAMPLHWLENLPYDNGKSQIFHRLPKTPFQR